MKPTAISYTPAQQVQQAKQLKDVLFWLGMVLCLAVLLLLFFTSLYHVASYLCLTNWFVAALYFSVRKPCPTCGK